jgi:hypothetical protein
MLRSSLTTFPRKLYTSQKLTQGRFHPNVHKRTAEYPDLRQISVSCYHATFKCLTTLQTKKNDKVLSRENLSQCSEVMHGGVHTHKFLGNLCIKSNRKSNNHLNSQHQYRNKNGIRD